MRSANSTIQEQWSLIQERVQLTSELVNGLDFAEKESTLLISDQLDELIMLCANLGIELRQVSRWIEKMASCEEQLQIEDQQWLESLMDRVQIE